MLPIGCFFNVSKFMFQVKNGMQVTLKTRPLVRKWGEIASGFKNGDAMINDAGKHAVNKAPAGLTCGKGLRP